MSDKVARLHLATYTKLEAFRTHSRESTDDLINNALEKLERFTRRHDGKGKFTK